MGQIENNHVCQYQKRKQEPKFIKKTYYMYFKTCLVACCFVYHATSFQSSQLCFKKKKKKSLNKMILAEVRDVF